MAVAIKPKSLRSVKSLFHCLHHPTREKEGSMSKVINHLNSQTMMLWNFCTLRIFELKKSRIYQALNNERGDVPGWVLVVLMTTGLVTAIWTIAAPRLTAILKNSLDAMNGIH